MHGASQRTLALRKGAQVLIRPILPEDKPLLKDAFDHLSEESRHRRFFSPIQELDAAALAYLCEVDHHDHEAVIAIDKTTGTALGVARYVRSSEEPVVAEAAVTVIDECQCIGLGRVVLTRLATRARREGRNRFIATVKAENRAAIELLEGLGNSRHAGEGSELTVVIDLPKRGIGAALERVLRLAASGLPIVSDLQSPRGAAVATTRRKTPTDGALDSVVAQLSAGLGAAIETATGLIFAEIPADAAMTDPDDREDVRTHLREHYQAALDSFREQRQVTREDLLFIRRHAALRVKHVSVADFIAAFHLGQRVLWERTLGLASDDQSRRAALGLVTYIARYFEIATTHAAEVYLEASSCSQQPPSAAAAMRWRTSSRVPSRPPTPTCRSFGTLASRVLRESARRREIRPCRVLPLPNPAGVAAGQERSHAPGEIRDGVRRQVCLAKEADQEVDNLLGRVGPRVQRSQRSRDLPPATISGQHQLRDSDQVVQSPSWIGAERDAAHRVGKVSIEAKKRAEAVLARQRAPPACCGPGHVRAASPTAPSSTLIDGHIEPPLGELMCNSQTGDPATEHRDRRTLGAAPRRPGCRLRRQ